MINLNEEFKSQQGRLTNIFGQHLKSALIIIIMNQLIRELDEESNLFLSITLYITVIALIFNMVAGIFLLCFKRDFPKTEYFLVYAMNLFMFLTLIVYALKYFVELKSENQLLILYIKSYIILILQKEIEILVIKVFPDQVANRSVNSFTNCIFPLMILSQTDSVDCSSQYSLVLLFILLINFLTSIFNTLFNLILFNKFRSQKELRNFSNLVLIVFLIIWIGLYGVVGNKLTTINSKACPSLNYIFTSYMYISPVNLLAFVFVIAQEIKFFKEQLAYQELIEKNPQLQKGDTSSVFISPVLIKHPSAQQPRLSLKSLSSVVNNPMENSESKSQAPNFGAYPYIFMHRDQKNKNLEKLGTSQFGASQHGAQGGMVHSWANVQDANPFEKRNQNLNQNVNQNVNVVSNQNQSSHPNSEKRNSRLEESFIRQEESYIPENQSQVINPMESGSVVTIH